MPENRKMNKLRLGFFLKDEKLNLTIQLDKLGEKKE